VLPHATGTPAALPLMARLDSGTAAIEIVAIPAAISLFAFCDILFTSLR
jgi:hypothetical protein